MQEKKKTTRETKDVLVGVDLSSRHVDGDVAEIVAPPDEIQLMEGCPRVLLAGVGQPGRTWTPPPSSSAHGHPVDVGVAAVQDEVVHELDPGGDRRRRIFRGCSAADADVSSHAQVHLVHLQPQLLVASPSSLLSAIGGHGAPDGPREANQSVQVMSSPSAPAHAPAPAQAPASSVMVGEVQDGGGPDDVSAVATAGGGEAVAEGEEGVQDGEGAHHHKSNGLNGGRRGGLASVQFAFSQGRQRKQEEGQSRAEEEEEVSDGQEAGRSPFTPSFLPSFLLHSVHLLSLLEESWRCDAILSALKKEQTN